MPSSRLIISGEVCTVGGKGAGVVNVAAAIVISTCWTVWAVVWLVTGMYTAVTGPRARTRSRGSLVSTVLVGFMAVLVAGRLIPHRYWRPVTVRQPWLQITGLVVLAAALVFTLWARRVLGAMWSGPPTVKSGHQLRTDGPYAITRHPIYTGMLGMFLGTSLAAGLGPYVLLFPVGLAMLLVKIRTEEQLMTSTFPDQYPRYRRQVPQLVPALRRRPHPDRASSG